MAYTDTICVLLPRPFPGLFRLAGLGYDSSVFVFHLCANSTVLEASVGRLILTWLAPSSEDRNRTLSKEDLALLLCRAVVGANCEDDCLIAVDSVVSFVSPIGNCACVLNFPVSVACEVVSAAGYVGHVYHSCKCGWFELSLFVMCCAYTVYM